MNGLMVDCSRLCERPAFYHHLIDLIADCGGDTLAFHFCDDHGLGLALPGFEDLAHPWAMDMEGLAALLAHAAERGVEVVPEVECFGHVRYLLKRPGLRAAFVGDPDSSDVRFNAIAPDHEAGVATVFALLDATIAAFPDATRIHIGCDEVDLGDHCAARGLGDPAAVWCAHVNRVIERVCAAGRRPLLWADHLEKDPAIRNGIDRRAGVISWHYEPEPDPAGARALAAAGFAELILAPAAICHRIRCLPTGDCLVNQQAMAAIARELDAGYLSTVWCCYRDVQDALYPGLAEGLLRAVRGGEPDRAEVARIALGSDEPALVTALDELRGVHGRHGIMHPIVQGERLAAHEAQFARDTVALVEDRLAAWRALTPPRSERWDAMLLAARCAAQIARIALDRDHLATAAGMAEQRELLALLAADWDRTRFAEDPARERETFVNERSHHLLACFARWSREGVPAVSAAVGV